DGIRDWSVTGVQTCALPICTVANCAAFGGTNGVAGMGFGGTDGKSGKSNGGGLARTAGTLLLMNSVLATNAPGANSYGSVTDNRSEERRVGKEGRDGGWADD